MAAPYYKEVPAINKKPPRISHYFEYAALRCVEAAVSVVPRGVALALGGIAGRALCAFGVYRRIVRKNLEHVGIWSEGDMRKITARLYRNMGRYAVDFLRRGKLPVYRLHGYDYFLESRARGKGTIIVLAHYGNWELLAAIWGSQVDDLNVIAKPMRNPLVENWLFKKRTALSVKTIYTKNALRGMLGVLRSNGITAILIDQYLGDGMGTPAPFLGKTASTVRTVAGLVRKTGAAAVPICATMREDGSYDINFIRPEELDLEDGADEEAVISAIQAQHNDILSKWIVDKPEHWFGWFHRRFRGYVNYSNST